MDPNDPPPPGGTSGPPPETTTPTSPSGTASTSSTQDSINTTPAETKRVTESPTTLPPHVTTFRGGAVDTPKTPATSLPTARYTEEESFDEPSTAMVKETKEHQDAEGRMGEETRAPRTNPETTELSDPKQSGFDLDSPDGMAHDSPTETSMPVKSPSKHTKKKP